MWKAEKLFYLILIEYYRRESSDNGVRAIGLDKS